MEYVVEVPQVDYYCVFHGSKESVIRCRACKWLGRETASPGEYRCDRTERMTTLDGFCAF